jgi:lysophospholipase L1-like esterase
VLIGDSVSDGIGADPTGDGSGGLAYGGAAIPAGATVYDDGVQLVTYPDGAGAGPADPGLLPHLVETALTSGFSAVRIWRRGVSGNTTATIRANRFHEAAADLVAAGVTPDLAVVCAGSNDSQTGENAAFEAAAYALIQDIERSWHCRTVWVRPIALAAGSYPEADQVRADIDAIVAARAGRSAVGSSSIGKADDVHPSLQGYRDLGRAIVPAYLAGS